MEIKKTALLEALQRCLPGVETGNSLLEGADTFVFADGHIYTYNDTISVSIPFVLNEDSLTEQATPAPFTGSVKAVEFFKLISKMPGEVIQATSEGDVWTLKVGKVKVELKLIESEIAGRVREFMGEELIWHKLPEVFTEALKQCHINNNASNLSGIFCADDIMMCTNGVSINVANLGGDFLPEHVAFWIPQKSGEDLSKVQELAEFAMAANWVHFKSGHGIVFSVKRLFDANFPYSQMVTNITSMEQKETDFVGVIPAGLPEALERAAVLSVDIESRETVKLTFTQAGIEVRSQRSAGKFYELVEWEEPRESEFEPIEMNVDVNMVRYGLKRSRNFYIHTISREVNGASYKVHRFVFTGEGVTHYMSTFRAK